MKVKELIQKLSEFDQDLDVYIIDQGIQTISIDKAEIKMFDNGCSNGLIIEL